MGSIKCSVESCSEFAVYKKWCLNHIPRCSVPDCGYLIYAHGMCDAHYRQWNISDTKKRPPKSIRRGQRKLPCTVEGCKEIAVEYGRCPAHLKEVYRDKLLEKAKPAPKPEKPAVERCIVKGCKHQAVWGGLCDKHYGNVRKAGVIK